MAALRVRVMVAGLVAVLAAITTGCGAGEQETSAPERTGQDLSGLLMQKGEEEGWSPKGEVDVVTGADAFVADLGAPETERERLEDAGFVSFTVQGTSPDKGPGAGISNVELYETEEGASTSAQYRLAHLEDEVPDPKADLQPFEVAGVPDSGGWTADVPPDPVANIVWVEGRCVMTLGNQAPGDLVKPLTAAVQAIHERVNGACP